MINHLSHSQQAQIAQQTNQRLHAMKKPCHGLFSADCPTPHPQVFSHAFSFAFVLTPKFYFFSHTVNFTFGLLNRTSGLESSLLVNSFHSFLKKQVIARSLKVYCSDGWCCWNSLLSIWDGCYILALELALFSILKIQLLYNNSGRFKIKTLLENI